MKYALLIYTAPDTSERPYAQAREEWVDYARAVKEAGILLGAEQLAETDTATSVRVLAPERSVLIRKTRSSKPSLLG